jgi:PAS domain S-box-containing protein
MDYRILYCFPFFLSATLIFITGLLTFRRVNSRGGWYLAGVCMASTAWAVSEGMLYLGFSIQTDILITKLQYFVIASVPPLTLLFVLTVFGFESWVDRRTHALFVVIAAAIVLLVWTNPLHKLFFTGYYKIQSGSFPMLGLKHGPLWWFVISYHYSLIAILSLILLHQVITSSGYQRSQAGVILIVVAFVWLSNAVYVSGNSPVPNIDISPIAFAWVAGAMVWGFFRYGLLDVLPVAKAAIVRGLDDIIIVIDGKDRILDTNPAAESALKIQASKIIGQKISNAVQIFPQLQQVFDGLESSEICLMNDGQQHVYDLRVSFLTDMNGLEIGKVVALRDITDRRQADMTLRESEEKYRSLYCSMSEGVALHEINYDGAGKASDYTFLDVNPSFELITGLKKEVAVGEKASWLYGTGKPSFMDVYARVAATGSPASFETYFAPMQKHLRISAFSTSQGKFATVLEDITERKKAEERLRKEKEKFRVLVETSPQGVALIGKDGTYKYINPRFTEMFGYSLADVPTGKEWFKKAFPDAAYRQEAIATWLSDLSSSGPGEIRPRIFKVTCKDGSKKEINFQPVSQETGDQFILYDDVSEKSRLETQLRQVQKMEAIGTFAGGIAHDFYNILAAIVGYTELLLGKTAKGSLQHDELQEILRAGLRARDLVRQILTFSRQAEQKMQPVQVNLIVKEALRFLRSSLPSSIEIRHNIDSDARVLADPTQIHQVLMNLCANAKHAMRQTGGLLKVSLVKEQLDADFAATHSEAAAGPHLKLTVVDSGEGMAVEVMEKIFDPFFTTKGKEEGTGLGLAVVHGIVKSCGGFITVYSQPGQGSAFNVFMPIIQAEARPQAEIKGPLPIGTERVLFVDDEKLLVDIGRQMMERNGYRVTSRTSSIEALELFKARPDDFDLVVTDMTMPNMSGLELAREIIRLQPQTPVILCTGFSETINEAGARTAGIKAFLFKPISLDSLIRTAREVLDAQN